jgi:hypothetical protein
VSDWVRNPAAAGFNDRARKPCARTMSFSGKHVIRACLLGAYENIFPGGVC